MTASNEDINRLRRWAAGPHAGTIIDVCDELLRLRTATSVTLQPVIPAPVTLHYDAGVTLQCPECEKRRQATKLRVARHRQKSKP